MSTDTETTEELSPYMDVIDFWFVETKSAQWWKKDPGFDQLIQDRFFTLHIQASKGELSSWRDNALGALAEIIVLDQFSRNIYRNHPNAFAFDSMALTLAQTAIASGKDLTLDSVKRSFMYMPFMHSESRIIHEDAVALFKTLGMDAKLHFEIKHKKIIDKFGRYPHRNEILGRTSSPEEIAFLKQPNSSF